MDKKRKSDYIDVDHTVLVPSLQRVRNILTLEERVSAIKAYDCRPMYTKVAKMFNCSWEQIKNIIANREAIMEFYEATKNTERHADPNQEDIRQRKIIFLGECVYEFIQRAQFHAKVDLSEELIRIKAYEFREVIQIDNFIPNKAWTNHFKATYNFSLSNRQITLTRAPPASLDLKDIMTYCTRNKTKPVQPASVCDAVQPVHSGESGKNLYRLATQLAISHANDDTLAVLMQRRQRKITFMEKALYEYIQRSQYHHKMPLNEELLRKTACELKDMLKIENFFPNKAWFNHFKNRYDFSLSQGVIVVTRTPPLSLDLKDILSYCSRHENKVTGPIKLAPKEVPKLQQTIKEKSRFVEVPPPATPAATINKTPQQQATQSSKLGNTLKHALNQDEYPKEVKQEVIELVDEEEEEDVKPNISKLLQAADEDFQPPPLKIQKIESVAENIVEQRVHSPGHWSEHSDKDDEDLPKRVSNYDDALKLLKPLEEFAMLEENYRVIGLISQLEEIFKNAPKSCDNE